MSIVLQLTQVAITQQRTQSCKECAGTLCILVCVRWRSFNSPVDGSQISNFCSLFGAFTSTIGHRNEQKQEVCTGSLRTKLLRANRQARCRLHGTCLFESITDLQHMILRRRETPFYRQCWLINLGVKHLKLAWASKCFCEGHPSANSRHRNIPPTSSQIH